MSSPSDDDKYGSLILSFFFLLYLITYFPRTNRYRLQNLGFFAHLYLMGFISKI